MGEKLTKTTKKVREKGGRGLDLKIIQGILGKSVLEIQRENREIAQGGLQCLHEMFCSSDFGQTCLDIF